MEQQVLKKCKFCGKEFIRLAEHIVRNHPVVLEKLEETANLMPVEANVSPNLPAQDIKTGQKMTISQLIQEKLDIMLNIKIIEMLSNSPNTTLKEIAAEISPAPKTTLAELKEYHNLVYGEQPPYIETGNQWVDIAQQAIPIIKEMLPRKKKELSEVEKNVREGEGVNNAILRPIYEEAAGDSAKPVSPGEKPGAPGEAGK